MRSPWAKQMPYVVSEEAKTTLPIPSRVAASSTLKVLSTFVVYVVVSESSRIRGIAAKCTTAS